MPLTILSRSDVKSVLLSLTREQVLELQAHVADALRDYSAGNQESPSGPEFQPPRTVITRPDGLTTLFMPASAGPHVGMRVMSAYGGDKGCSVDGRTTAKTYTGFGGKPKDDEGITVAPARTTSSSLLSDLSRPVSKDSMDSGVPSSGPTRRASRSSISSGEENTDRYGSTSDDIHGSPLTTLPSDLRGTLPNAPTTSPYGCVTLLDSTGAPAALINAQELSAFRTALTSSILFMRRKRVKTITVFGAGRQAYWHIYLALLLRGEDIKHVNIINRSFPRTTQLLQDFYHSSRTEWRSDVKFATLCRGFVEYDRLVNESIRKSDVIFCCTPATEPLFDARLLTTGEGRTKGRLISAIGSYTPNMVELDPKLLKYAIKQHPRHRAAHVRHAPSAGVIVVDCIDASLTQSGEVIKAELTPNEIVEIGELVMVKEEVKRQVDGLEDGVSVEKAITEGDRSLLQWMRKGIVVFKSVGMGMMDILLGGEVLRIATAQQVGTIVPDF